MNWQDFIPKKTLTLLIGKLAHCRTPWLKRFLIQIFIRHFSINLQEALESDPEKYACFNDFFVRALKPTARQIDLSPNHIVSPVDGSIVNFGKLQNGELIQAKNHLYRVADLLAQDAKFIDCVNNGKFITIYLAPYNYHRVHMPYSARLKRMLFVPGKYFSVNMQSVNSVPNLFARNERLICEFEAEFGNFILIFVGAMLVAGIETVWHGAIKDKQIKNYDYSNENLFYKKGEEIGRFQYGSTVILLFPQESIKWREDLVENQAIYLGNLIADLKIKESN